VVQCQPPASSSQDPTSKKPITKKDWQNDSSGMPSKGKAIKVQTSMLPKKAPPPKKKKKPKTKTTKNILHFKGVHSINRIY
jgi:hypothetical protein